MEINKQKQTVQEGQKKLNSRRTILKRASAGVVLSTLPAQSVWGAVCSLSGAQSGNMSGIQRHKDCEIPPLSGGRSPGTWKNLADFHSSKLHGVFINAPGPNKGEEADAIRGCYMQTIKNVADANNLVRPQSYDLINSSFVNNIYEALGSHGGGDGSLEFNLAGVWLNVYFGLYNNAWAEDAAKASAIVEQFVAYIVIQTNAGTGNNVVQSDFGFDDGSTEFELDSLYCDSIVVSDPNASSNIEPSEPCTQRGNSNVCK